VLIDILALSPYKSKTYSQRPDVFSQGVPVSVSWQ